MAVRLRQLIDLFLEWCQGARAPKTTRTYKYLLDQFATHVGDQPIEDLKPFHLSTFAKTWHQVQSVQRLFEWAKEEMELLPRNPFAKVKRPPAGERRRILPPRELVRWLRAAQPAFRRFLVAMRETLARPQEVRLLRWEYLQPADPMMKIEEALAIGRAMFVLREYKARKRRKNPGAPRLILVNRRFGRMLLRLMPRAPEDRRGPVLLNWAGEPFTANCVRCCMRRLRRKFPSPEDAEEKIVAYTLRHSGGTLATAAGVRDRLIADMMGHSSTRTTARYQHLDVEHLWEGLDLIDEKRRKRNAPAKNPASIAQK